MDSAVTTELEPSGGCYLLVKDLFFDSNQIGRALLAQDKDLDNLMEHTVISEFSFES